MKIIFDTALKSDNVLSIVASSEDPDFPVTNLQNDFTTDIWRAAAGVTSVTLTVALSKGSAFEILNTNATSCSATVNPGDGPHTITITTSHLPGAAGRVWADFGPYTGPCTLIITLTAATPVSAGILRAGVVESFDNPQLEMEENSKDFSIELELNNGSDYYRKRNVVKTFPAIQFFDTKANAFKLKHDIFDAIGPKPLAIYLADSLGKEFVLFAKRLSPPKITYHLEDDYFVSLELKEVI